MEFIKNIDDSIALYFYDFMSTSPILKDLFYIITSLGDAGFIWILIALLFLVKNENRKLGIIMLISLLIGALLGNVILKNLFERARPFIKLDFVALIPPPAGFSFPSGHSLSSFIGATCIYKFNKKWGIPAYILAFLIAISRVILSVHFLSDIIAGSILGILIAIICFKILTNKILVSKN